MGQPGLVDAGGALQEPVSQRGQRAKPQGFCVLLLLVVVEVVVVVVSVLVV